MIDLDAIDAQGRPDLLNSERAMKLARHILDVASDDVEYVAMALIEVQQSGLRIGRSEIGVGSPYGAE